MSIVPTNINYNSTILRQNLNSLVRTFPFLNVQSVGLSVLKKNIYVIKLGKGTKKVLPQEPEEKPSQPEQPTPSPSENTEKPTSGEEGGE